MILLILAALISLVLFFHFQNQRLKRMEDHHERSKERFEKLLETLRNKQETQDSVPSDKRD